MIPSEYRESEQSTYKLYRWLVECNMAKVTDTTVDGGTWNRNLDCLVCGKKDVDFEFPRHFKQKHSHIVKMFKSFVW